MGKLKGKGAVITGRRQQALDEAVKVIGRNVTSVRGVAVFFGWMVINIVPGPSHFDPPPFTLLDTIGALESILLASFILMRQSWSSEACR